MILQRLSLLLGACALGTCLLQENNFKVEWGGIYENFLNIAHGGLKAHDIQDDLLTNFDWEHREVDGAALLRQRLESFSDIFETNLQSIARVREAMLSNWDHFEETKPAPVVPLERSCCDATQVNDEGCITTPQPEGTARIAMAPREMLAAMVDNQQRHPHIIMQYVTLTDGGLLQYPSLPANEFLDCDTFDPRRRYWYVECQSPYPRDVVLLLDRTSSASHPVLLNDILDRLLDSITSSDRLVVVPSRRIADGGRIQVNWGAKAAALGVWMDGHEYLKKELRQLLESEIASTNERFESNLNALHWAEYMMIEKPAYPLTVSRDPVDLVVLVTGRPGWDTWRSDVELRDLITRMTKDNVTLLVLTVPGAGELYFESEPRPTQEATVHIVPVRNETHLSRVGLARYFSLSSPEDRSVYEDHIENALFEATSRKPVTSTPVSHEPVTSTPVSHEPVTSTSVSNETTKYQAVHAETASKKSVPYEVLAQEAVLSLPYWSAVGTNLISSLCLPITINGTFRGTVCSSISIVNLFQRIMTIPNVEDAYVFAMDRYGRAMIHPLLKSPTRLYEHPKYTQMTSFEKSKEVLPILQHMIDGRAGSKVVDGEMIHNVGHRFQIELPNAVRKIRSRLQYTWGRVRDTRISMAVVMPLQDNKARSVSYKCKTPELCKAPHFQYHRWDLDDLKPVTCRFFGMEVAKRNALVKLSPSCFSDELDYIRSEETPESVAKISAIFRQGNTMVGYLVGTELREDIALGERAEEYWRSAINVTRFIGARYLGTAEGVFVVYPGTQMPDRYYDPRIRPWYRRAVANLARDPVVAVSTPYCDSFGSGLVVTLSVALTSPPPHPRQVVGVVAGDFPSHYINDLFIQQVPDCEDRFRCFLIDNSGYVVVHSKWQENAPKPPPACKAPLHGAHINVVEPAIGRKLVELNVLRRQGCLDYVNSDLFLYWTVSLPNRKKQMTTRDFTINHIPFTNLYLIVYKPFVESTVGCHCPKTRILGLSSRCRSTCHKSCECPCIAAPNTLRCDDPQGDLVRNDLPPCWPSQSATQMPPTKFDEKLRALQPCYGYNCTATDRRSCSKQSIGCFWHDAACHDINTL